MSEISKFKVRKRGWQAYRNAAGLLDKYSNRRRDKCHGAKTSDDRALDAIKSAFMSGWKHPHAPLPTVSPDIVSAFEAGQRFHITQFAGKLDNE